MFSRLIDYYLFASSSKGDGYKKCIHKKGSMKNNKVQKNKDLLLKCNFKLQDINIHIMMFLFDITDQKYVIEYNKEYDIYTCSNKKMVFNFSFYETNSNMNDQYKLLLYVSKITCTISDYNSFKNDIMNNIEIINSSY